MQDNDLLKPSLAQGKVHQPIYSVGALIATAFFGGALAVPIVAFENARRQRRLGKDILWIAVAIIVSVGILYAAVVNQIQSGELDSRFLRIVNRATGFGLVGLFYVLHRTAYRTQQFAGVENPSPYAIVIFAVLVGIGATVALSPLLLNVASTGGL